jgi:tetratricopeptide (TPR) repeat protein/predicted Ser/Thr protein kinase
MVSLHERAKDVFLAALDRPVDERRAYVEETCGSDAALFREVESLLKFHEQTGSTNVSDTTTGHPGGGSHDTAADVFNPGDVFAGRYRMVTRLGRGGMGDVWRADDLVLETPVALKLIRATGPAARAQILNEVRLARQITHPAVCRVFDVGEDAGIVFFSMELVNGEDLATLLRRVGRLTTERVLEIARQLCAGLASAHAQGVLHRDLKPANILIDNHGRAIITDFGIAILREDGPQRTLIGTPGYMAPEQLMPGATLSECTDIYALGLILYELLVGQHPFNNRLSRTAEPPTPSSRVTGVDPRLERIVLHALKADPKDRPQSAAEMVTDLDDHKPAAKILSGARRRPWFEVGAVIVGVIIVAAIITLLMGRESGGTLSEQDTIVLADFANTTGDPVFDGALKVALSVALEQSPFLKVFPDDRMRETLRLMGKPPDAAITRAVGREIAQREQFKALLAGSIAGLGRNFVLALEAVNADTGDVMAREQVEAGSKEQVLSALGGAAARLRGKLGESLASIQKFDAPLARATTPSLEALHAYSLALDNGRVNPRLEAIPHLRRAIELDPNFALAMALLSTVYSNTGQTTLAPEFAKKAYDLRDRVSERERFFIGYRYNRDATQNVTEALELSRSWTATYPREAFAFNSLGQSFLRFGQFEQAAVPLRESIKLDAKFEAPYSNLAASFMGLERYDDAAAVLQEASAARLTAFPIRRMNFLLAFIRGDEPTMARMIEASVGVGQTNAAYGWQAHALAHAGKVTAASEQFRLGVQMARQAGFQEVAGQLTIEGAEVQAIVGLCDNVRSEVASALELSRDNFSLERGSRALILCGQFSEGNQMLRELRERFPSATLTTLISIPIAEAAEALRRNDPRRVLALLEPVKPYEHASRASLWPEYLRGQAFLRLKDGGSAAAEFKSVLGHRGEDPTSSVYPLARLGLARAQVIAGDTGNARQTYEAFLSAWSGADAGLPPLVEARNELASLK